MTLPYKNPLAYKQLRTWQQAKEILELTEGFIQTLPKGAPERSHMDRSARSTIRNIEEGFRRTTTKEYISFLGFSAGSNEELMGDFEHCLRANPSTGSGQVRGDKGLAEKGFYLTKGESRMLYNQIKALENKMYKEKTMSRDDWAKEYYKRQTAERKKESEAIQKIVNNNR